ncbi:MAG: hypothetical protein K2O12_03925, partial [Muribaculaceae bacterium]|nr:hypothetical protein [Muribaculaceae bacterium]
MSEPRLHIFNPENDGALAFGKANYTPPASAWQMHLSGEAMPLWYGSAGDRFISYGINARWLDSVCGRMNIDIDVASDVEIASGNFVPCPWGWSDYARRLLYDAGYPGGSLPSDESISCWRALSNRALTVKFNSLLAGRFGIDAPVPEVVVDPERLRYLCSVSEGYIKQPWSCSGRGVMHTASVSVGEAVRRSQGAIRRQGAVMWEPALDRVCDFAMLFTCTGGTAVFEGLSMFISDPSGRYGGNVLDTQCAIEHKIFSHLECGTRQRIQTAVTAVVNELIAPYYSGPMGVDMMIYR